jgi:CheY-like chemotaxis protein
MFSSTVPIHVVKPKPILLVEDNPDDVTLFVRTMLAQGLWNEIVVARDGVEALDYLLGTGPYLGQQRGPLPDLPVVVVLDLNMPKMGGLDVLRRIRADERLKFLPVIIFTSSEEEQDMIDSRNLGANAYVHKPADVSQFIRAVTKLGVRWVLS